MQTALSQHLRNRVDFAVDEFRHASVRSPLAVLDAFERRTPQLLVKA